MLSRALDDSYAPEVRENVTLLTTTRLAMNSGYRYAVPFLAVIADGMHTTVGRLGLALTAGELAGLAGPLIGRTVDRVSRRAAQVTGMLGLAAGAIVVATAHHLVVFGLGLVVLAFAKIAFDVALIAWIADHVPIERRGRVIGITETSWAASLFIGVALLGAVTALTSWRWAYAVTAAVIVVVALVLRVHLPDDPHVHARRLDAPHTKLTRQQLRWVFAVGLMVTASQLVFVELSPWLKDDHGMTAAGITGVVFGLGACELVASTYAARLTDRWGGRRSVRRGGALLVPATLLFALGHRSIVVGLVGVAVMLIGFEFAIVSAVSVASDLMPASPARSIGMLVIMGTFGRAAASAAGTRIFESHGAAVPAFIAAGLAAVMVVLSGQQPASPGSIGRTASTYF